MHWDLDLKQIHQFYRSNDVTTKNLFGYQPGINTVYLYKFTDKANQRINHKRYLVLALFIDFFHPKYCCAPAHEHDYIIDNIIVLA